MRSISKNLKNCCQVQAQKWSALLLWTCFTVQNSLELFILAWCLNGDSKAYIDILDVYGVCEEWKAVKQNTQTSGTLASLSGWRRRNTSSLSLSMRTQVRRSLCRVVYKRDCVNHVTKNFRKETVVFSKYGVKIDGLKSLTRSKHGIGPTAIAKLSEVQISHHDEQD